VLKWLSDSVKKADVEQMAQVATARAKAGDVSALRLLLSYLIGQPTQYIQQQVSGDVDVLVTWADDNDSSNPAEIA